MTANTTPPPHTLEARASPSRRPGRSRRAVKNIDTPEQADHNLQRVSVLTRKAARQFDRLPVVTRARVNGLLERLERSPEVRGAKALAGNLAGWYRLRAGDYRLRFRVEGEKIIVDKIGHRSEFYER